MLLLIDFISLSYMFEGCNSHNHLYLQPEILMNFSTLYYMDHQKTETRINFVDCLETDVSIYIMSFLDDPADLVRISAVSRLWRQFG